MTADQPALTLDQAAVQLGISSEAVRLRVRRGKLRGERVGGQWRVYVDQPPDQQPRPTPPTDQQTHHGRRPLPDAVPQLTARVAELETDRAWLRTRLEAEAQERAELRRLLGNMQAQLMALLPPPQDMPIDRAETAANGPVDTMPAQTSPRPWWAFWRT